MKKLIITLNIIGIICLIYCSIPYITHDTTMPSPETMLSGPRWDSFGFLLLIGTIPLLIVNILAYKFINVKLKKLFFIPSIICIIIASHYLITTINFEKEEKLPETTFKCVVDNKVYKYSIYKENNEYSLGMEENDKLPLSKVDYTSIETIINSVEEYYKSINGYCP